MEASSPRRSQVRPRSFARSGRLGLARVAAVAVVTVGVTAGSLLAAPSAEARSPEPSNSTELQISWRVDPPMLRLQPEGARLVLTLPTEWMPPADLGFLRVPLDPNRYWHFRNRQQRTSASIGQGLRLQIDDREHALWFGLSVLPRAAFAVLRFDPMPASVR